MREFFEVISEYPFTSFFLGIFIIAIIEMIVDRYKNKDI